ncbi:MAG: zinc ribbon domain-containing protein [Gemmatimonadota bacterium]
MEMLVIALVAIVAFAIVLIPLFRRGTGATAGYDGAAGTVEPPEAWPRAGAGGTQPADAMARSGGDAIEREVQRYRAALRAGTVCTKCGQANPAGSIFCYECGARVPLADAREFE